MFFKNRFIKQLWNSFLDLLPILLVVLVFQILVIQQPVPNILNLILGTFFVVLGLALFMLGLEQSLFPIGEAMAFAFARKGSVFWLLAFAFSLGFGTTIAEPSLVAVAAEAAKIASTGKLIAATPEAQNSYALGLRISVALSVGFAILIGALRIIRGWPLHYVIVSGYLIVIMMTFLAPPEIVGIAYDAGGVTASTVSVPLITALGVGLASSLKGRNPLIDGFGLIAFASLTPMIFVIAYGMLV